MKDGKSSKLKTTMVDRVFATRQNELGGVTLQGPKDKVGYKPPMKGKK